MKKEFLVEVKLEMDVDSTSDKDVDNMAQYVRETLLNGQKLYDNQEGNTFPRPDILDVQGLWMGGTPTGRSLKEQVEQDVLALATKSMVKADAMVLLLTAEVNLLNKKLELVPEEVRPEVLESIAKAERALLVYKQRTGQ